MRNNVTILDIARETNFSANTVSRALRDMPDISEGTKEIIRNAASSMGYTKNILASTLRTNRSQTIGVIVPDIQNPVYSGFFGGIEEVCKKLGYNIVIAISNENADEELQEINSMICRKVDGIIICPADKGCISINVLKESQVPFVFLARTVENYFCNTVISNDYKGGYMACEHLISKGYTSFLQLSGPQTTSSFRERSKGFLQCLRDYNIPEENADLIEIFPTWKNAYDLILKISVNGFKNCAIFAHSDFISIGVIKAFNALKISIPNRVAIIGYDNVEISDMIHPSLTTIDIKSHNVGAESAKMLLKIINGSLERVEGITSIDPKLIIREST